MPRNHQVDLPLWPPLLAARAPGSSSAAHAHHGMHLLLALEGELQVNVLGTWRTSFGVLTAPWVEHAIDARGAEVFLVFFDPESDAGATLRTLIDGPARLLTRDERDQLQGGTDPIAAMGEYGVEWTRRLLNVLGAKTSHTNRVIHPRVREVLRILNRSGADNQDLSLQRLAETVGLSPSRLMHVFTESMGIPLRPYLAWLRLQRAAAGIVFGMPLSEAALAAGFADGAHMTRSFRRMLGMAPSALRRSHGASQMAASSFKTPRRP